MILNTWIVGLMVGQVTILATFTFCVLNALLIFLNWNYDSSDEKQYQLEKRTYLVSALMKFALVTHLFLFSLTALALDEISELLPGAMCAVGVLSANEYGFPYVYLKIVAVFLFSTWLIINYIDSKQENYPLVSLKYLLLIIIFPTIVFETVLFFKFTLNLDPQVITSCCGSIFNEKNIGVGGLISALPNRIALPALFAVAILSGFLAFSDVGARRGRRTLRTLEALTWIVFFILSLMVVISFISIYIYEMPTHRCPFCFLQSEYNFIGFPLYGLLFLAAISGFNRGILEWFKLNDSLAGVISTTQNNLGRIAVFSVLGFLLVGFTPFLVYYLKTGRLI